MEYSKTIFMCFIDYSRAFDCVDHSRLWNTLRTMGVPEHLIALIKSPYTNQEAAVKQNMATQSGLKWERVLGRGVSCPHTYSTCTVNIF